MEHYASATETCLLLLEDFGGEEYIVDSVFFPRGTSSESSFTCVALLREKDSKIACYRAVLGDDLFDEAVSAIVADVIREDGNNVDEGSSSSDDDHEDRQSPIAKRRRRSSSSLPGNEYWDGLSQPIANIVVFHQETLTTVFM